MSYTPNNLSMFTAAFAGALAGMGASDRVPTNDDSNSYINLTIVAGAFAQSFDTNWGLTEANDLTIATCQELCEVAWQDRSPNNVAPLNNPSNYTQLSKALIAMITAGGAYFATQGITPGNGDGGGDACLIYTAQTVGGDNAPLLLAGGAEFEAENGNSYLFQAKLVGGFLSEVEGATYQIAAVNAHASGGVLVIDGISNISGSPDTINADADGLTLKLSVDGNEFATINWKCCLEVLSVESAAE